MVHPQCPRCHDVLSELTETTYVNPGNLQITEPVCVVCQAEVGVLPGSIPKDRTMPVGRECRVGLRDRAAFDAILCSLLPAVYMSAWQSGATMRMNRAEKHEYIATGACDLALVILKRRNDLVRPVRGDE